MPVSSIGMLIRHLLLDVVWWMDASRLEKPSSMTNPSDESLRELEAAHTPEAVRARLEAGPPHSDLRDFIFGAIDGTVTTFAVVSGVSGAGLSASVLIILGVANLVADGFSMGVSNFLAPGA